MSELPPDIKTRREVEDRAAQLGDERRRLQAQTAANTQAIIDLLRDSDGANVTYEQLASLLGVTRQTVFTWREQAARLAPGESAAEYANKRTPDGHALP